MQICQITIISHLKTAEITTLSGLIILRGVNMENNKSAHYVPFLSVILFVLCCAWALFL